MADSTVESKDFEDLHTPIIEKLGESAKRGYVLYDTDDGFVAEFRLRGKGHIFVISLDQEKTFDHSPEKMPWRELMVNVYELDGQTEVGRLSLLNFEERKWRPDGRVISEYDDRHATDEEVKDTLNEFLMAQWDERLTFAPLDDEFGKIGARKMQGELLSFQLLPQN